MLIISPLLSVNNKSRGFVQNSKNDLGKTYTRDMKSIKTSPTMPVSYYTPNFKARIVDDI